jgi:NTP pyrophosphatase (non-canonical NTP hydrolase)
MWSISILVDSISSGNPLFQHRERIPASEESEPRPGRFPWRDFCAFAFGRSIIDLMESPHLTISQFQKHIFDRYEKVDRERGTPKTFLWLIEEIGELATALNGTDRANLEEEFADCLAWLCTLANINDVDLATAITKKYLGEKRPEGHK